MEKSGKGSFSGVFAVFIQGNVEILTDWVIFVAIPDETLRKSANVVFGNDDSYAASMATKEFERKMFLFVDYQVLRCIDVSCHHYLTRKIRNRY